MAKKQLRNRTPKNNSKAPAKTKAKTKSKKPSKIVVKNSNKKRSKIIETANGDSSSEDTELAVVPSPSVESEEEDNEVAELSEAEDDGVEQRSSSEEEEEEDEAEEEEEEVVVEEVRKKKPISVKKKPVSVKKKGKKNDAKSKGKKKSRNGRDELEAEEKSENALYTFPMNRISRIVKSDNPDVKIAQEAVFLINKASEKFLQVFSKEAYASAFLQKKKQIAYHHLSSVVSKRKRFEFLSDIVPEKVKAEDALPQVAEAEEMLQIES